MHRIYVGNLQYWSASDVRAVLAANNVHPIAINTKDKLGIAFLDFANQNDADLAVEVLSSELSHLNFTLSA